MSGANTLMWTAQIILACTFFYAGMSKILAFGHVKWFPGRHFNFGLPGISTGQGASVGLLEVAGALGLLVPSYIVPNYLTVVLASAGLALLMVGAAFYRIKRNEPAAPAIALCLLAVFIIVGRWSK